MNISGISGNTTGVSSFRIEMNKDSDPFSKSIQSQIANAQKQMQELGDNKDMSPEEKMKKRQEIQQQITDLQNQLRQHQIEQRKESQKKNAPSMTDMLGGNSQHGKSGKSSAGMSSASMQAIISADISMDQVKVQGAVKADMDGKSGILESEIKLDEARGEDTTKKKEALADLESKAQDLTSSQLNTLSDASAELKKAAESEQNTAEADRSEGNHKVTRKDKDNTTDNVSDESNIAEYDADTDYESVDVLSEGITVSSGPVRESSGNNVNMQL